jgi:hypothetical protein
MAFYAFRLNSIFAQNQRGHVPDVDVVTFQVLVNTVLRGQGMITLQAVTSGTTLALALPPSNTYSFTPLAPSQTSSNISTNWIIGPMQFAPTDGVSVVISITNISDNWSGTDQKKQDETEIAIANAFYGAMLGEVADGLDGLLVGSVLTKGSEILGKISDILGVLKDPVGELLGADSGGPCNGLAFASETKLLGNEVAALTFVPPSTYQSLPGALEFEKSVSGDDSANHNTGDCGHVAETTVSFSVLQLRSESLRTMLGWCFPTKAAASGLRQFVSPGKGFSLRNLVNFTA